MRSRDLGIILAGKRGSRRHWTMGFSDVVVESNVGSFIILRTGEDLNSFNKNNRANVSGEKICTINLFGVYIFENTQEKKLNLVLVVVLEFVLESKGL